MMFRRVVLTSALGMAALAGAGCQSNTGNGALIGGGAGAALGALAGGPRHALGGAVLGGALGAATGAIVGNEVDREEARRERYYEYRRSYAYGPPEIVAPHAPDDYGPPPPPPYEAAPPPPFPGAVWVRGYWIREPYEWVWVRGYWR